MTLLDAINAKNNNEAWLNGSEALVRFIGDSVHFHLDLGFTMKAKLECIVRKTNTLFAFKDERGKEFTINLED
ncbi:hypothetical protein VCHA53O466_140118 [Vibrio chagasii]|nr:hypothetical protein VCHA53O466_140118 [Vibrio chagasii]